MTSNLSKERVSSKKTAIIFFLIPLFINEYILSIWLELDQVFSPLFYRVALLGFDLLMVSVAILLLINARIVIRLLFFSYHQLAIILIAFLIINVFSIFYVLYESTLKNPAAKDYHFFVDPSSKVGLKISEQIHNVSGKQLKLRLRTPQVTVHPRLNFIENAIKTQQYTVGVENIRYYSHTWSDDYVREILSQPDNIYVFGGSTTFGDF